MQDPTALRKAADLIQQDGLIICPTETVYGFSCSPYSRTAIDRLNNIKQRPDDARYILLGHRLSLFENVITGLDEEQYSLIDGAGEPTSWVCPAHPDLPEWLRSSDDTVCIRVTALGVIASLCDILNTPLISTSANFRGKPPTSDAGECRRQFGELVDIILEAEHEMRGTPSTIRNISDGSIIRN